MATEKLFTVAGTATDKGITKVRFANDLVARIKILNKAGCTDIDLIELPKGMTKLEALQYLTEVEHGKNKPEAAEAIAAKLKEKTRLAKRAEVSVAVKPDTMVKPPVSQESQTETETETDAANETA